MSYPPDLADAAAEALDRTMSGSDLAPGQVEDAEFAEAEFMYAFESAGPAVARAELGVATARRHGGVVLAMANDPTGGYWNKTLGLGLTRPITDAVITDVLDFYRRSGSDVAVLQIAPAALPGDWDKLSARHGIVAGNEWVKLLRPPSPAAPARTDLRVAPLQDTDAGQWAEVMLRGFEMPQGALATLFAGAVVNDPGFLAFGVWDGDRMVSAGNLYVRDGRAAFCGVATLPEYRGRGAQSALFAARVEAARAAGARVLSAETWKPAPGATNSSLNNMVRAGFAPVYDRVNWVWRAA